MITMPISFNRLNPGSENLPKNVIIKEIDVIAKKNLNRDMNNLFIEFIIFKLVCTKYYAVLIPSYKASNFILQF